MNNIVIKRAPAYINIGDVIFSSSIPIKGMVGYVMLFVNATSL